MKILKKISSFILNLNTVFALFLPIFSIVVLVPLIGGLTDIGDETVSKISMLKANPDTIISAFIPDISKPKGPIEAGVELGVAGTVGLVWFFLNGMVLIFIICVMSLIILFCLFIYFFGPAILLFPFLPFILLIRQPPKILFLRKFNNKAINKEVKKNIRKTISSYAHVYTLADKHIKIPWHVRIPLFTMQLSFLCFKNKKVKNLSDIENFLKRIQVVWARNINWFVSKQKSFPISTNDEIWEALVIALINEVDFVFMDLSEITDNIEWELKSIISHHAEKKMVFFTNALKKENVLTCLNKYNLGNLPLIIIDDKSCEQNLNSYFNKMLPHYKSKRISNKIKFRFHFIEALRLFRLPFIVVIFGIFIYLS